MCILKNIALEIVWKLQNDMKNESLYARLKWFLYFTSELMRKMFYVEQICRINSDVANIHIT